METIKSFLINHDAHPEGVYLSHEEHNIYTYDLRFKKPNAGDFLTTAAAHTVEHLFATVIRNSAVKDKVVYFGPMGCRTGFYLLMRSQNHECALEKVKEALRKTIDAPEMFGASRKECGNYKELSIEAAHKEATRYLKELEGRDQDFKYPTE